MKTSTKFNFKTLTVLILSLVLCCSLAFTAACSSGESSSSSSSTSEETVYPSDVQTITNGDFEFSTFTTEAKNFPVSSSIGWTLTRDSYNSSYAPTSKYSSGIIDTSATAYAAIAESAGFKKEGENYYNPGTPYDNSLIKDGEYVTRTEGEELVNDDKLPLKGTKILMLHNETSTEGEGTAQKFTSGSTLSLTKGTYGKLSLWVKTYALSTVYEVSEYGAYVAVENTVSSSLSPVIIKNINTDGEWVKYSIYLRANELTDSSFKVILGLGFGSGKFKNEYVEGFAYFDDVTFSEITADEYNASGAAKTFGLFTADGENVSEDELILSANNSVLNNADGEFAHKKYAISHVGGNYTAQSFNASKSGGDADAFADTTVSSALSAINSSAFAPSEALTAPVSGSAIYAIKNNAESGTVGSFEYTTGSFEVGAGEYYAYTFFVKSFLETTTRKGLTVTVNDLGALGVSAKKVTTDLVSNLCTNDYENEQYNDWQKYTVLVSNTIDLSTSSPKSRSFSLTFTFGEDGEENWNKAKGYFVAAGLQSKQLSETEYNFANTTDAIKVSLTADLPNGVESDSSSSDSYGFTYSSVDALNIKNGVASNVIGYTGVAGNSNAVGGDKENVYSSENVISGVINTNGLNASNTAGLTAAQIAEIEKLGKSGSNSYLQPLMINNKAATSFGYYGSSSTLSANTVTLYSVRVKVLGGATAYVYLTNANSLDGFNVLSVENEYESDGKTVSIDKPFEVKVSADQQNATDGWHVVYIAVATGNASKNVRIELWNGSRDGKTTSTGVVLFDAVSSSTVDLDTFKAQLKVSYDDTDETAEVTKYIQKPTTVLKDDDNGDFVYDLTGKKYSKTVIIHDPEVVFTVYKNSGAVIGSFETIDVTDEIDNRTLGDVADDSSDDDSSEEEEVDDAGFSWALQITSIIIAVVLIALLIVVLIRMLVKKSGRNKEVAKTYYNRDSRDKTNAKVVAQNAKKKAIKADDSASDDEPEAEQPEVKPYDYDNMENNLEPENGDETQADEGAEEASEQPEAISEQGDNADVADDNADGADGEVPASEGDAE